MAPRRYYDRALLAVQRFIRLEAIAGILLFAAAALALVASNGPLAPGYAVFLDTPVEIRVGTFAIAKPLLLWINDGLMALFFLLAGAEIKREVVEGELSSPRQAMLPLLAAFGGMLVPALIYLSVNGGNAEARAGWAIPTATDIAFALGVLSLLGRRVPIALKTFLLALAIIDDLGAIVVIALFYTSDLSATAGMAAALVIAAMTALNLLGVRRVSVFAVLGVVLWICVLKSGVHATLAGVITAWIMPSRSTDGGPGPLARVETAIHPWIVFLVLPLFGFVNAGVTLGGGALASITDPVAVGIMLGLLCGKQIGAFAFSAIVIRLGWASLPTGVDWKMLYGASLLAGVGFTMSLFIGTLAWEDAAYAAPLRLGVLGGSLASGILGYWWLRLTLPTAPPD